MTKSLCWAMLLFVVSGCVALTEESGSSIDANPETPFVTAQSDNIQSSTGKKIVNGLERDYGQPSPIKLDAEEIRKVQNMLKTVGFYSGRIDGDFSPKTRIALLRLRSSCSALNDLMQEGALAKIVPVIESSGANRNNPAGTMLKKEDIRVIQVRLKDAGFNPGIVDGIVGPNTRAAVAQFRFGCGAAETIPAALLEAARSRNPDDITGATMAIDDIMNVAIPRGGLGSMKSGSFVPAGTNDANGGAPRPSHR